MRCDANSRCDASSRFTTVWISFHPVPLLFASLFLPFSPSPSPFLFFPCVSATTRRGPRRSLDGWRISSSRKRTRQRLETAVALGDRGRERSVNVFIFAEFAGIEIFFLKRGEDFLSFREYFRKLVCRYFKRTATNWNSFQIWKIEKVRNLAIRCFQQFLIPSIVPHAIKKVGSREFQLEVQ